MNLNETLKQYANKRILITGGAGCVGSNLIRTLLTADPERIDVIDDLSASYEWNLPKNAKVVLTKGSILDEEKMRQAFRTKPHYVFHLAAHFANQNSVDQPETDMLVNGLGTLRTLQYANLAGAERYVFASSGCSVYGSQAPLPLVEEYISLHLDTPYQINKLVGELYCNYFREFYGLPVAIARFFNVYGPGEVPGRYRNVIPNFMYRAMRNESLVITGSGEETRDFAFVDDIVDGTLRLGVVKEAVGEAMNLASSVETKISDLAQWINEITENRSPITYSQRRDWDKTTRRRASIDKARKILGYDPKSNVKDKLLVVHKWFKDNWDNIIRSSSF